MASRVDFGKRPKSSRRMTNGARSTTEARESFWEVIFPDFWSKTRKNPEKTPPEKHPEIDAEKVRKNMEKHAKNMLKVGPKSYDKTVKFREGGIWLKAF